jgi:FkbM family methyltransferase
VSIAARIWENCLDAWQFGPAFACRHFSYLIGKPMQVATVDGFRVHLRLKPRDAVIFRQIFRYGDWDFNRYPQARRVWHSYHQIIDQGGIPLIIDAGANVGAASLWFARLFPEALIIAIEPDPDNVRMCRMNTKNVTNVTVIEAAIGSTSGTVTLYNTAGTSIAAQTKRSNTGAVPLRTVSELIEGRQLFIVKIDIEGFESDLFLANTEWIEGVTMIMIETHDWMLPGQYSSRSMQRSMAAQQFEMLLSGENIFYVR